MSDLEVRNALAALVNKLDAVVSDPSFGQVFTSAYMHGIEYTGPDFGKELEEAKRALLSD